MQGECVCILQIKLNDINHNNETYQNCGSQSTKLQFSRYRYPTCFHSRLRDSDPSHHVLSKGDCKISLPQP